LSGIRDIYKDCGCGELAEYQEIFEAFPLSSRRKKSVDWCRKLLPTIVNCNTKEVALFDCQTLLQACTIIDLYTDRKALAMPQEYLDPLLEEGRNRTLFKKKNIPQLLLLDRNFHNQYQDFLNDLKSYCYKNYGFVTTQSNDNKTITIHIGPGDEHFFVDQEKYKGMNKLFSRVYFFSSNNFNYKLKICFDRLTEKELISFLGVNKFNISSYRHKLCSEIISLNSPFNQARVKNIINKIKIKNIIFNNDYFSEIIWHVKNFDEVSVQDCILANKEKLQDFVFTYYEIFLKNSFSRKNINIDGETRCLDKIEQFFVQNPEILKGIKELCNSDEAKAALKYVKSIDFYFVLNSLLSSIGLFFIPLLVSNRYIRFFSSVGILMAGIMTSLFQYLGILPSFLFKVKLFRNPHAKIIESTTMKCFFISLFGFFLFDISYGFKFFYYRQMTLFSIIFAVFSRDLYYSFHQKTLISSFQFSSNFFSWQEKKIYIKKKKSFDQGLKNKFKELFLYLIEREVSLELN